MGLPTYILSVLTGSQEIDRALTWSPCPIRVPKTEKRKLLSGVFIQVEDQ